MTLREFARRYGVVAAGLVMTLAGMVVLWLDARQPRAYGWFLYAPAAEPRRYADYLPGESSGVDLQVPGMALVLIGVATTAGGLGYRLGLRGRRDGRTA